MCFAFWVEGLSALAYLAYEDARVHIRKLPVCFDETSTIWS